MSTSTNSRFEFVKQLGEDLTRNDFDIPPFPDTALRVQRAMDDPDMSMDSLSDIILSEPVLAARLMRMANSALLRGSEEITDLKTAISRMGLDMVKNVAVSFAAKEAFHAPEGSALEDRLSSIRKHSIQVAVLAYFIGRKVEFVGKPDEAMLAGLLHAIGKFYILMRVDKFPELFSDEEALETLMAQWHNGVGRAIVESWGFTEMIAVAVDEYELTDRNESLPADITDLVLIANLIARADGAQSTAADETDPLAGLPSLARMKIDVADLRALLQESSEEISYMTQTMNG